MRPTPEQAVASINGVFGCHPGCRAAHARGTLCTGVFTPTSAARRLTRAPHMREPSRVTVRFSNASGDPDRPDGTADVRGMATRFHCQDAHTDIVAVTLPCFFVRSPEAFIAFNRIFRPRAGATPRIRPLRALAFLVTHPEAVRAIVAARALRPVPSYANCRYNAIHAFRWLDDEGNARYLRYSWVPEEGTASLPRQAARRLERDYLQQDLYDRLGRAPARPISFRLELALASRDDVAKGRVCDPTTVWPRPGGRLAPGETRRLSPRCVTAGVLELDGLEDASGPGGDGLVFDPMNLLDGVEPSDDQILKFRPAVYDVSFRRRTGRAAG